MTLCIMELNTGKVHKRRFEDVSCSFEVEGSKLVVRDYYTRKPLHRYSISKFGSVKYWVE